MTYTLTMISTAFFAAAAVLFQTPGTDSRIVLDAEFDDWSSIKPAFIDPADAAEAFIDFGEVRISHDERFVHLLIDVGREVNAQGLDGVAMIVLDVDGDAATGRNEYGLAGADIIIDLSPASSKKADEPGMGIGLRSITQIATASPHDSSKALKLNPYDIGFAFAPTYAATQFEFRIQRAASLPNTPSLFVGNQFNGKIVFIDLQGRLADETDSFTHQLTIPAKSEVELVSPSTDPLARAPGTNLRALSWNVHEGGIFTNPQPFTRILAAIKPDVIFLQELDDKNTGEQLRAFLNAALPQPDGAGWNVIFGSGGGNLRCAVASISQMSQALPVIASPERPKRSVRTAGCIVEHNGKRMLVASVHLKCCGRAGGSEDIERQTEAQLIHQTITTALAGGGIDGVIIAGDLNLVGSHDPIELLAANLDLDRSALAIADADQLDGLSNATWADRKTAFAPGRLDYLLFADSRMTATHSFVFDSRDLSAKCLKTHGILADDTSATSDHLPLVVDLQWTAP